jgi:asparagine synthase (glutamine-hydrolysing)
MCGFVGFLGGSAWCGGQVEHLLELMTADIRHRGPDHRSSWTDPQHGVALGHTRLAIVELSSAGNQPMESASGRYVIVYNGEIYNHLSLRRALEKEGFAFGWRGHSDTESLLAGIEAWGVRATLERAAGMFAFALWDRRERRLVLARDRVGEKPVYYGWQGNGPDAAFLFGSELKPFRRHPAFVGEIDRRALSLFMRHNYVPAPFSIYRDIFKLQPGMILTLDQGMREPRLETYWSGLDIAERGIADPLDLGPGEAVDRLEDLLLAAVGRQMMSDVPLGAFLSGGVDSSTIVAMMQSQSGRPVKTFTIGFKEGEYNEAEHAKRVAAHLGTDHTEVYVTPAQARSVIPLLPTIYDEPFADSSQVPTRLVCALAREHVTVSLSGDGGDELFAGYNRYVLTQKMWRRLSSMPRSVRGTLAAAMKWIPVRHWNTAAGLAPSCLVRVRLPGDKIHKVAAVIPSGSSDELYYRLVSLWRDPAEVVIDGDEPPTLLKGAEPPLAGLSDVERMMALDLVTYLPDDILCKVDRAAMSVSLETRVPLLDPDVIEFAWRLPLDLKVRDGQSKWALRQVLYRHVPRALIERPKMGFAVPIGDWLRGPLREWAEDLISPGRLGRDGYFHAEPIQRVWADHISGQANMQYLLWCVLMFQSWLDQLPPATPMDERSVDVPSDSHACAS